MTILLGGITLSDHLTLDLQGAGVGYSQRRLIGGASVIQVDGNVGGQVMVLNSASDMTKVQLDQIKAMQSAGIAVELVHHRGTFQALIVDTSDMTDDFEIANPDADPTLTVSGNITLIEV
nr:hypothetical protein [uncultured Desulfobulbus sp.]